MKRRSFVKTSVITGAAATLLPSLSKANENQTQHMEPEFYELRVYTLKSPEQQKLVEDFYQKAAIPALNRLGVKHVGVFTEMKPAAQTRVFVFIPYSSMAQFTSVADKLENDATYKHQGAAYLTAPATSPAYERIESSLLKAFAHMPKMQVPDAKPRIFELRQYQSASEAAGKKKIEMFNDRGEVDIFKRLEFRPVFFAETVIGPDRPNLTYMVTFDNMQEHDEHWKAFGGDTQWKEISAVPDYADALLVSKITATFIVPTSYSQI